MEGSGSRSRTGPLQIMTDLDPDRGGPKAYESYGSGFRFGSITLLISMIPIRIYPLPAIYQYVVQYRWLRF
jgi:hypothetical protein